MHCRHDSDFQEIKQGIGFWNEEIGEYGIGLLRRDGLGYSRAGDNSQRVGKLLVSWVL